MKKVFPFLLLFAGLITGIAQWSNASAFMEETPGGVLYRFAFPAQTELGTMEAPDHSILVVSAGDEEQPGCIVRFDPATKSFRELTKFSDSTGRKPCFRLVSDEKANKVYGTTSYGGKMDGGVIYSLDVVTGERTTLFEFADAESAHPQSGLIRLNKDELIGISGLKEKAQLFTYNIRTHRVQLHQVTAHPGEQIEHLPVVLDDGTIVTLTSFDEETKPYRTFTFVEYNLRKKKVTHRTDNTFEFLPRKDALCKGVDGAVYVANNYGLRWVDSTIPEYALIRYDPVKHQIKPFQIPPVELTVWGPPLSCDKNGNLLGAFLYGGKDNAGYVIRYELVRDSLFVVKEWKDGEPGGMTCAAGLLHHSNGLYYGFSSVGGQDQSGRFYSLDPVTGRSEELADFLP